MQLNEHIKITAKLILNSKHIVIFTGAGLSTASGLPDFRGPNGVWTRRDRGLPPPETKIPYYMMRPNLGHYAIVELEKLGKVQFLISQNVDGFHLDSGFPASKIAELHGNKNLMICMNCNKKYSKNEIGWNEKIFGKGYRTQRVKKNQPRCQECNGRIISSIVNFGDPLPEKDLNLSIKHCKEYCDLMIVLGSSLVVTPASNLVGYVKEKKNAKLIINNLGKTPYDNSANLLISHPINEYFPTAVNLVKKFLFE